MFICLRCYPNFEKKMFVLKNKISRKKKLNGTEIEKYLVKIKLRSGTVP
jgi:hypothetical protein